MQKYNKNSELCKNNVVLVPGVRVVLALLFLCCLSGCATNAKFEALLNSYMDRPESELVENFGVPKQVYETGGNKYLVYESNRNAFNPGIPPSYQTTVYGNTAYTQAYGGVPASVIAYTCTATFTIRDGKIIQWSYRGNDCVSDYTPPKSQTDK